MTSTTFNRLPRSCTQRLVGFTLIDCLIVNALALVLLGILLVTSAQIMGTASKAADRSEQAIRARQVFDFLDAWVNTAQMPDTWRDGHRPSETEAVHHVLMGPCLAFDPTTTQRRWGGFAIVDLATLACLPGVNTGAGLYVERVLPCPEQCGEGPGYQIVSTQCHLRDALSIESNQWQVSWQKTMARPDGCLDDAPWGRVERMVLSHRSAKETIEGVAVLRLHQIAQSVDATYRWLNPETIVLGIDEWLLDYADRLSDIARESVLAVPHYGQAVRVNLMVGPHRSQTALPAVAIERLVISGRNSTRG